MYIIVYTCIYIYMYTNICTTIKMMKAWLSYGFRNPLGVPPTTGKGRLEASPVTPSMFPGNMDVPSGKHGKP